LYPGYPFTTEGYTDILTRLKTKSAACPLQKFALVGYSQGGVITKAVLKDIPADIEKKIVAVVLYGATDASDQSPGSYKAITLANCAPGDFVCFPYSPFLCTKVSNGTSRLVPTLDLALVTHRTIMRGLFGMIELPNTSNQRFKE
jgi:hypothetical protein